LETPLRSRLLSVCAVASIASLSMWASHRPVAAQEAPPTTGPTFNWGTSRVQRTCPDRTAPTSGKISVAQASVYVACSYEERPRTGASIDFVDILKLQIAPTRRKVLLSDIERWPNINQKKPIYVLRGSVVLHQCYNITNNTNSPQQGANCTQSRVPKAIGTCWQDKFDDWFCFLGGYDPKPLYKQPAPQ
jgi:hypothetical protein